MKKISAGMQNLLRAIVFSAGFLVILCVVSYILRPYSGSVSRKNLCGFYAEKDNTLDAVFIGASSCFAFWEAMEAWNMYGLTSYNFAAGVMPPQMMKYCVKEVQKTQNPVVYVIDLRPFTIAESGYYLDSDVKNMDHDVPLRNTSDNFRYSLNRFRMIHDCVPDSYDKIPYYFDIIKYHTEWPRLKDAQSLSFLTNSSHNSLKGFLLFNGVKAVNGRDFSAVKKKKALSDRLNQILYDLLDYCKEEKLQVLFLANAYCQSKSQKKIYNCIGDVVQEYGFQFLNTNDYYDEIGLDFSTDYYDTSHVNIFGADKYTRFVGNYLTGHYSFEDKRGQKEYEQWDRDYEEWCAEVRELKQSIQEKIDAMKAG